MKKKIKIAIIILLIILLCIITIVCTNKDNSELRTIKSNKELSKIYEGENSTIKDILLNIITMPFSFMSGSWTYYDYPINDSLNSGSGLLPGDIIEDSATSSSSQSFGPIKSSSKDYSTTNIQVENVDEADITKTDGDYIYSISENDVVITNILEPNNIEIAATIKSSDGSVPEDLILYKNELIVISTSSNNSSSYYYNNNSNTIVKIYDITQKEKPILLKKYELYEPYYTSRCINNVLYVISSGNLREEDDEIITYYKEDGTTREIGFDNIKYLKDVKTTKQTLISVVDLDNAKNDINVSSYLVDISNAYVSENSIYLLDQKYDYNRDVIPIKSLFGIKGAIGPFIYDHNSRSNGYYTEIYKFDISKDGYVTYSAKTKIKGKTINQYSLDEYNGHLRIALYDGDGARVAIFNEKLKEIGISEYVAKGETMYSSRFINDKVYLVTYRTTDPLFVIDLSNEQQPKILGELKIPGYSTYLHPYDENHIIGFGYDTKENGTRITTSSLKMVMFDITDLNNPKELFKVAIGDRYTSSTLTYNHKSLLFSKEKNIIAFPLTSYENRKTNSRAAIYEIDLEKGFILKGEISHLNNDYKQDVERIVYVGNTYYTLSKSLVKAADMDTLEIIKEIGI